MSEDVKAKPGVCTMRSETDVRNEELAKLPVLDRESILKVDDKEVMLLEIPEWGGAVYIRVVSGHERDRFEEKHIALGGAKLKDFRARLCALVACDAKGNPIFDFADVEALTKKSAAALDRIFDAGMRLNRMTDEDVKEMTKNLKSDQSDEAGLN